MTIDFYNNVHRKGVTLRGVTVGDADLVNPNAPLVDADSLERASRVLSGPMASRFDPAWKHFRSDSDVNE